MDTINYLFALLCLEQRIGEGNHVRQEGNTEKTLHQTWSSWLRRKKENISNWMAEPAQISCPQGGFSLSVLSYCHRSGSSFLCHHQLVDPFPSESRMARTGAVEMLPVALRTFLAYWHLSKTFLSSFFCFQPSVPLALLHFLCAAWECRMPEPEHSVKQSTYLT